MGRRRDPLAPATIGGIIMLIGALGIGIGHVNERGWTWRGLVPEVAISVGGELIAVAVVILMVDRIAERREQSRLRQQLVREMSSSDHGLATRAIMEIESRGWLAQGALVGARLTGAALQGVVLERADLHDADLAGADLRRANLSGSILRGCNLTGATMSRVILEMSDLSDAILQDALLDHADMARVRLNQADLAGAILTDADLTGADLRGANLCGADLTRSRMDTVALDAGTKWDDLTRWPVGYEPQPIN